MNSRLVVIESDLNDPGVVSTKDYSLNELTVLQILDVWTLRKCTCDSQNLVEHVQCGVELLSIELLFLLLLALLNEFLVDEVMNLGLQPTNDELKLARKLIHRFSTQIV